MELDTPGSWWSAAWSWGFSGSATGEMMSTFRRSLRRPLSQWERDALAAGHAEGVKNRAEWAKDREELDRRAADTTLSEVPF